MTTPNLTPAQRHFVDDEMLRVPLLAEQLLDAILIELRESSAAANPHERAVFGDLLQTTEARRPMLVRQFAESMRRQVEAGTGSGRSPMPGLPTASARPALALLDEEQVASDVEISNAIEAIKSTAEHELRELATYTSALAGDMDVRQDHNPFRAETYARALWEAAQALPMSRGIQIRFMHHAGVPLAQLLRKAYAGACARLESAGIEPAVYRTLILPAGVRSSRPGDSWIGRGAMPNLQAMRATMPAQGVREGDAPRSAQMPLDRVIDDADQALRALPADAPLSERARLLSDQRSRMVRHAERAVDQQLIELLSRLFDAILTDPRIDRDVQITLSRLQPAVMRLALRDPSLLDDFMHPVWQFMDHIAYQASLLPGNSAARADHLKHAEGLIERIAREAAPDARRYRKALEQLAANDLKRLEVRVQRAAPDIATLQALEDRLAAQGGSLATGAGPLDVTHLDTVPAKLMEDLPINRRTDSIDAAIWLDERHPGEWLRMFLNGDWVRAQLLWQGRHGDAWLFGEGGGDVTCAVRRRALERLYVEGLASLMRARSLVRAAAQTVVEQVKKERGG